MQEATTEANGCKNSDSAMSANLESSSPRVALLWSGLIAAAALQAEILVLDQGEFRDGKWLLVQSAILPIYLAIACYWDLRWRLIPNWLNSLTFVLVLALATFNLIVGPSLIDRSLGALMGFGCILFGHSVGMFGAGDVKAAAVLGAFWGREFVLDGLIYSIFAGGGIAVLSLIVSGQAWRAFCKVLVSKGFSHPYIFQTASSPVARPVRGLPFACALGMGAIVLGVEHAG